MSRASDPMATETELDAGAPLELTGDPDTADDAASASVIGPGDVIGRYIVVANLGAGAMGIVVAAYDPKLDRKVALKLLHPRGHGKRAAKSRLQREAQALAKLAHPNVVVVHDVGIHRDRIFLAMEHVEGWTLSQWLELEDRSTEAIIDVFVQAARGLSAAHEAGLVHRDFKPDNVMVDARGRVRVMDFGLARADDETSISDDEARDYRHGAMADERLTRTGAIMGTPVYMAPEQLFGLGVDARSDQFSYCVALYEALYGRRPFEGKTVAELATKTSEGSFEIPVVPRRIPANVRKVVTRGLHPEPDRRWPDMETLATELSPSPRGRRRGLWALASAPLLAGAVAFAMAGDEPEVCAGAQERVARVWHPERRQQLRDGLLAIDRSYAPGIWERVELRIDEYTREWAEQRTQACESTRVHAEQSEELMDRRMHCLDRALDETDALIEVLSKAEARTLDRAVQAANALPALSHCSNTDALMQRSPRPTDADTVARLEQAEHELAEALALARSGQVARALPMVVELSERAEEIDYAPFLVTTLHRRGKLEEWSADPKAAVQTQRRAFFLAVELGDHETAAQAGADLAFLVGNNLAQFEQGLDWVEHAHPHAVASGSNERLGHVLSARGNIAFRQGRYAEADRDLRAAYETYARQFDPTHRTMTASRANLGNLAYVQGDYATALEHYTAALDGTRARLGPDHPGLASAESNLGNVETDRGNYEQAQKLYESALARHRSAGRGETEAAASALSNLGRLAALQNDSKTAREMHERCLEIRRRTLPADHWQLGATTSDLAAIEFAEGNLELAGTLYRQALKIEEESLGSDHTYLGYPLQGLGDVEAALGHHDDAKRWMERALRVRTEGGEAPGVTADSSFALARLLWDAPAPIRDRSRAKSLGERALFGYRQGGPNADHRATEVEIWLRERDRSAPATTEVPPAQRVHRP